MYSFGVGALALSPRMSEAASRDHTRRFPPPPRLVDMIERVGKVCKVRLTSSRRAAAEAGPVERCKCARRRRGRCGTRLRPDLVLSCRLISPAPRMARRMDGAVPIGMDRAAVGSDHQSVRGSAGGSQGHVSLGRGVQSGEDEHVEETRQRVATRTKCLKERAALATAIEAVGDDVDAEMKEEKEDDDVEKEEEEESGSSAPRREGDVCVPADDGGRWRRGGTNRRTLTCSAAVSGTGSARGRKRWAQFEAIRTDRTLSFYGNTLPADAAAPPAGIRARLPTRRRSLRDCHRRRRRL